MYLIHVHQVRSWEAGGGVRWTNTKVAHNVFYGEQGWPDATLYLGREVRLYPIAKPYKNVEDATAVIQRTLPVAKKTFRQLDAPGGNRGKP